MKMPVYLYGHPVLRQKALPVEEGGEALEKLVADMFETMYASEGVGLAAPQVGVSKRLVVIDADAVRDLSPECAGRRLVLVNPEIEYYDDEPVTRAEGCLSLPGLSENVSRVEHIRLRWLDEKMQPHEEELSGFLSRIVQHELDHLEGIVYTDRIKPLRKQLIRGKLNNIIAGKAPVDYPVRIAPKHKR